jgi:hypothetical protein
MIVGRSILVRRRTRRNIEDAIANGTWLAPTLTIPVKLSDKPSLYEAHTILDPEHTHDSLKEKGDLWDALKPVSVTLVRSYKIPMAEQLSIQEQSLTTQPRRYSLANLLPSRAPVPPSPTISESQISFSSDPPEYGAVTISVMIAMPFPPESMRHQHDQAKQEYPDVEFGISDVELPLGWSLEPRVSSTE